MTSFALRCPFNTYRLRWPVFHYIYVRVFVLMPTRLTNRNTFTCRRNKQVKLELYNGSYRELSIECATIQVEARTYCLAVEYGRNGIGLMYLVNRFPVAPTVVGDLACNVS